MSDPERLATAREVHVARAIYQSLIGEPAYVGPFDDEGYSVTLDGLFSLRDAARAAIAAMESQTDAE